MPRISERRLDITSSTTHIEPGVRGRLYLQPWTWTERVGNAEMQAVLLCALQ